MRTGIHCTHGHQVDCCDFVVLCRLISVKCDYTHNIIVLSLISLLTSPEAAVHS